MNKEKNRIKYLMTEGDTWGLVFAGFCGGILFLAMLVLLFDLLTK